MNLYVIVGAGIVVAAMTGGAYFKGHSSGVAEDKARSDLVITGMVNRALEDLAAANAANAATTTKLQATKEKAEHELQTERSRAATRAAAAVATDRLVRDTVTAFASGAGADQTSVLACIDRSKALGDLLAESVRVQSALAEDGESCEANIRALRLAWPASGSTAP